MSEKKLDTKSRRVLDANASGFEPDERGVRIGASIPVSLIRGAYDRAVDGAPTNRHSAAQVVAAAERAALEVGRKCFGDADPDDSTYDAQILAIARREATLRGTTPHITYHDEKCERCGGTGELRAEGKRDRCVTCLGDGFAPANEGRG